MRVYGILIEDEKLLVTDEYIKGIEITKLPGGGLEFGEGTVDCVVREFREETGLAVEARSHFYTTDFFVASAFNVNSQVISIYYLLKHKGRITLETAEKRFDFKKKINGAQTFRWIPLDDLSENDFTFVIDRKVATLISEQKDNLK